jgi:hypothetical protein
MNQKADRSRLVGGEVRPVDMNPPDCACSDSAPCLLHYGQRRAQRVYDGPAVVYARRDGRPVEDVQAPALADLPPPARPASGRKRRQWGSRNRPRRSVVAPEVEDDAE